MQLHSSRKISKKKQFFRIRIYLFLGVLALVFIFAFYAIREFSFFKVKDFAVHGKRDTHPEYFIDQVTAAGKNPFLARVLGPNHYFAWDDDISFEHIELAHIAIEKDFFTRSIAITLQKRERFAVWCFENSEMQCFWFDEGDGFLISKAPTSQGQLFHIIHEKTSSVPLLGERVIDEPKFTYIKHIVDALRNEFIAIQTISLDRELQELRIITPEEITITFSLRFDPKESLSALFEVLRREPQSEIRYIDLTVPNKVYLQRHDAD